MVIPLSVTLTCISLKLDPDLSNGCLSLAYRKGDNLPVRIVNLPVNRQGLVDGVTLALAPYHDNDSVRAEEARQEWISAARAARLCGLKAETLARYRRKGKGPQGYRPTGYVTGVYPFSEVMKWNEERRNRER